jgi:UDP-hydrolysing UDP-N-acetyl-D-glucosamine 2-epimerase
MNNPKRKICVVLVDRANYGRMKPVMEAIKVHPYLAMQVVVAGTMVLERFGSAANIVVSDGFSIDGRVYMELEGSTPATMAKSVGFGIVEYVNEFLRLQPDILLIIGDRYEALAAAIAAAYMNICIAHIQGGEVSGSIDESARHAISKFAQFHFPSTQRSADFLVRMGEDPKTILSIGCPSSDLARIFDRSLNGNVVNNVGSGAIIDTQKPFLLVVFHPITTEYGGERVQMEELLKALKEIRTQTFLLWPNIDAGADHVSKAIRRFRDQHSNVFWLRTIINLPPEQYLKILANASCVIGNSSSFVRDSGYFGTPVVLVGNRQDGREHDRHLTRVSPVASQIITAIKKQLDHGRYAPSALYGDGYVAERVAVALAELKPYVQKRLHYVYNLEGEGTI